MHTRIILTFLFALAFLGLQAQDSPIGRWETRNDDSGEIESIIEIYEQDDKYFGRIAEIVAGEKDALCTECDGKQKNKPMLGLVIIKDLERDGDEWNGGTVLDPQRGADYRLSVWFDGDPDKLYIRGKHWTGIYRTQTWTRQS